MKLLLSEIPANGHINFTTSINATIGGDGLINVNVSQSVRKNFPSGHNKNEGEDIPIKGTAVEVKEKLAELGLSVMVE